MAWTVSIITAYCQGCSAPVQRHYCGEVVETDDFKCETCDEKAERNFQEYEKKRADELHQEYQAACAQAECNSVLQTARAAMKIRVVGMGHEARIRFRQNSRFSFLRGETFEAWGETVNKAKRDALAHVVEFLKQNGRLLDDEKKRRDEHKAAVANMLNMNRGPALRVEGRWVEQ